MIDTDIIQAAVAKINIASGMELIEYDELWDISGYYLRYSTAPNLMYIKGLEHPYYLSAFDIPCEGYYINYIRGTASYTELSIELSTDKSKKQEQYNKDYICSFVQEFCTTPFIVKCVGQDENNLYYRNLSCNVIFTKFKCEDKD